MAMPLALLLLVYPLLEVVMGTSKNTYPLQEGRAHSVIAHLHGCFAPVLLVVLLWRVSLDGLVGTTFLAMASTGLSNGASGIVSAHELGHRRPGSASWWLARLTLFSVLYLHFTTEHNHTHHRHWARERDPTSSPWGRSIYAHFIQTIPRQIKGAYLARPVDTRRSLLVEFGACLFLAWYQWPLLLAFLVQAFVAIYLLEFVNYIQHHGLSRAEDERPTASHAWESRHRLSRWTLLELPLHASHHLKSSTPYHRLEAHDESPQLPLGYYGMFWLTLIPPLFSERLQQRVNLLHTPASEATQV